MILESVLANTLDCSSSSDLTGHLLLNKVYHHHHHHSLPKGPLVLTIVPGEAIRDADTVAPARRDHSG